jgi:hypothetical protein
MDLWHQVLEFFGVIGESGKGYGFWSGVGSDIGELAIVGALAGLVRQRNCHVDRCWRLGRHPVEGTPHTVCRRHHPDGPLTHARLLELHGAHRARLDAAAGGPVTPVVER